MRAGLDRWRTIWSVALLSFFGGALFLVLAGDEAGSSTAVEHPEATHSEAAQPEDSRGEAPSLGTGSNGGGAGCLSDAAAVEDLRKRKEELDARLKEIAAREADLKAREQAINDELKKLAAARDEIDKIGEARRRESDAKLAKLVETIETMNPKAGSQLLGSLEDSLAVSTMAKLSTARLAKLLNVMDTARSTKLSELLAGVVRARGSAASAAGKPVSGGTAVTTINPGKRGDKNDGKSHEQASNRAVEGGKSQRQPAGAEGQASKQ